MARVIKTLKGGRQYYYDQASQRVAGKVVTKSKYLGPVNPKRKKGRGGGFSFGAIGLLAMAVRAATGKLGPAGGTKYKGKMPPIDPRTVAHEREKFYQQTANDTVADIQARAGRAPSKPTPMSEDMREFAERLARVTSEQHARHAEQARFDRDTAHNVRAGAGGWDRFHQLNAEHIATAPAPAAPAPQAEQSVSDVPGTGEKL